MLPYLPVEVADPGERLCAAHERVSGPPGRSRTEQVEASPGPRSTARSPRGRGGSDRAAVASAPDRDGDHKRPGSSRDALALGRELQEMLPYVPIADRVRTGVAIYSYRDALTFGVTGDYDAVPDVQKLADGIADSMDELVSRARPMTVDA